MGTLRSASDCSGLNVKNIILGSPIFTDDLYLIEDPVLFAWEDTRLPDGFIEDDGKITLNRKELQNGI